MGQIYSGEAAEEAEKQGNELDGQASVWGLGASDCGGCCGDGEVLDVMGSQMCRGMEEDGMKADSGLILEVNLVT